MREDISIRKVYVYEREACDCCEGWYEVHYELYFNGEYIMSSTDSENLLQWISDNTAVLDYEEEDYPEDD